MATIGLRHRFLGYCLLGLVLLTEASHAETGALEETPLARPANPRGATMFTLLPPETTGIRTENNFADPKMKGALYQEFETSSIGTGVAIGDYDGDGRPDVFVVSKTESCRLFRNLGDWKFEDVTEKAGVGDKGADAMIWKQGATFVDVNNDGRLDLYVCRARAPNLLYLNQGDGTFKEEGHARGLDINDSSVMAAFCDYDRDGWLDVCICTNILDIVRFPRGQRAYMLHNNGDGTFANVTDHAGMLGENQSHSVTWWDYDNDGWPDLYLAYDFGLADTLYHNNRDGTFTDTSGAVLPHTSFSSMGADLGDMNNDGRIDFLVADMAATGHFGDHHSLADARGSTLERGDDETHAPKYHRSALLLNNGTPYCQEAGFLSNLAATDWTWSPRFEDLDNDGRLDLHVTNGFPRDPGTDTVRRMQQAESTAERVRIMYDSPMQAEKNIAMRNLGELKFESVGAAWGLDQKGVSFGAAFGDLDGDGDLDLVYSNYRGGVTVLRNDCETGHRVIVDLRGTVSNRFGVGATVRLESALGVQVRQLVLARGYMSSSEPMLHFGLGDDTSIRRLVVTWPSGLVQTLENLGVDRRFTITEPSGPRPPLSLQPLPPAAGQFAEVGESVGLAVSAREEPVNENAVQKLLPLRLNRRGPALAIGSLTDAGRDDVVIGGTSLDQHRVLLAGENGRYTPIAPVSLPASVAINDGPVLLLDVDGDGHNDLLVTKGGNSFPAGSPEYQPELLLGDGHGGFHAATEGVLPALLNNVGAAAAADFDHDGKLDVFLGGRVLTGEYPRTPASVLLANRGGKLEDVTETLAPGLAQVGMVTAALWTDVDGDGWVDLVLTLDWGGVKYFHNQGGTAFEDRSEQAGFAAAGTGWWTSLTAADFNGDGRPDYVVGNLGLNTQYHADPQHPALLYAGDFKRDGSLQLIEGYYEGETVYPWRSRANVGAVMPWILKKFPKDDFYARATLEQIYGADALKAATRLAATELRSGVFLSQPDGTFRFEALPRYAQISPVQGAVAGDFDGDGHADLYIVQNNYAPIPQVGRFDGGVSQLLRGDGHGHFTPVPPSESTLLVPGNAKALVVLDLDHDGWPDFLASQNRERTLAFRNRGVAGRHSFRVVLHGPTGNSAAVGSRITVELSDGSTQTSELYAGSGYYSQSAPGAFFGYPDGTPPKTIRVRWPSGVATEYPFRAGAATLEFTAP